MNRKYILLIFGETIVLGLFTLFISGRACTSNLSLMLTYGLLVGVIPLIIVLSTATLANYLLLWTGKRFGWGALTSFASRIATFAIVIAIARIIVGSPPDIDRMLRVEAEYIYSGSRIGRVGWFVSVASGSLFVAEVESARIDMQEPKFSDWTSLKEVEPVRLLVRAHDDVLRFTGISIKYQDSKAIYYKPGATWGTVFFIRCEDRDIVIKTSDDFRWLSM